MQYHTFMHINIKKIKLQTQQTLKTYNRQR